MSHIADRVKEILTEQLNVPGDQVTGEASLVETLETDSMDVVELILKFESEFNLEIPEDELGTIHTVKDAITFIQSNHSKDIYSL